MDIADKSKKVLLNGFIESVKSLEQFADAKEKDKEKEFRKTKKLIKMLSGQLWHQSKQSSVVLNE